MRFDKKDQHTSELLTHVVESHAQDFITVEELKNALHARGFGVLLAIASLPMCIPAPVPPGYTTFFSVPLFIFTIQMMFGMKAPWLPQWLGKKKISRQFLATLVEKAVPYLRRVEKLLKPRMQYIDMRVWEKAIGFFGLLFTISIAIPLPLTNFLPGVGILIMSLGMLGRDGAVISAGIAIGVVGLIVTALVLLLGAEAVSALFHFMPDAPQ